MFNIVIYQTLGFLSLIKNNTYGDVLEFHFQIFNLRNRISSVCALLSGVKNMPSNPENPSETQFLTPEGMNRHKFSFLLLISDKT